MTGMDAVLDRHAKAYGDEHDESCPLCGVDSARFKRYGECQHPAVTDQMLVEQEAKIRRTWGDAPDLTCPDCHEYLYLCEGCAVVCAGEPHHAGDDPAGRPNAGEHPEYWME